MRFWVSPNPIRVEVEPDITLQDTRFRPATPSRVRLLVFLYHVTQGATYPVISNQFGIGISTVSKCIHDCTQYILLRMYRQYIRLLSREEAARNMENWRAQTGIPGIVAAIDGTHISIKKPNVDGEVYFNRKHFYSLNVQGTLFAIAFGFFANRVLGVVDFKKRFIDIEVGWPGSVGDGRIWQNSVLSSHHKVWLSEFPTFALATGPHREEQVPAFILADSAYPNTKNMVTTFKNTELNSNRTIRKLNAKLGAARYHVENAFGIMKMRFQLFKKPLECSVEDARIAIYLTSAIFVLHNFLIDVKDSTTVDPEEQWIHDQMVPNHEDVVQDQDEDESTRHVLIRHMEYLLSEDD